MNGGYVLIDCKELDLTKGSNEQTITGLYARVREAMKTGKPIMANKCVWGDKPVTPIYCFAIDFSDYIIVTASTLQVVIQKTDVVTIINLVGE